MTVEIYRLPALRDNYIFLLHDRTQNTAAVVDPAEPRPVLQQLEQLGATLTAIFNTHHHSDHVGANRSLLKQFPQAEVYGGVHDRDRIPHQHHFLEAGDQVSFGEHRAQVFFVPGHTRAHIAYFFPPQENQPEETFPSTQNPLPLGVVGDLFCGDTLFAGGCGRLFEGTPQQMVTSLSQIRQLPNSTRIWCAHEYTLGNLKFALSVDRHNPDLHDRWEAVQKARQNQIPTVPSVLGLEKRTNPFLRWDHPDLQAAMNSPDPVKTFARLRGKKDLF